MKHFWDLLTAIFWIAASCGLFAAGWLLSGGRFDTVLSTLAAYGVLVGTVYGIGKGIATLVRYSREQNSRKPDKRE